MGKKKSKPSPAGSSVKRAGKLPTKDDLILIKPWPIQGDSKSDLVYRYLPAERNWLYRRDMVPEELVI